MLRFKLLYRVRFLMTGWFDGRLLWRWWFDDVKV